MKSVTDVLHRTPWWALLFGGLATFVALVAFVTPYHILQYRDGDTSSLESRAIKREVDNAFAENAINVGRSVIRGMLSRTTDPDRRAELEEALSGLEEARGELANAGVEVLRARKEALDTVREATRASREAIRSARRETEAALKALVPNDTEARQQLEEKLREAIEAEALASRAMEEAKTRRIQIGPKSKDGKSIINIEIDPETPVAPMPKVPSPAGEVTPMPAPPSPPSPMAPMPNVAKPAPPAAPAPPAITPEAATRVRRDVTGDLYRMGIGAGLVLLLLPLFILAVVTKFFADRSRGALKVADTKKKEAEYHRMSQQVTEAKLAALQAQVEPHFLYNTLASVQALTEVDPARANAMTGHLIQYLRNALPKMRESVSTVGQEIELVRAYLSILQMRMGARLTFEIDVPEALAALPFPPLMLPSLVENAIKHGLEPQREGGNVHISASQENGRLRLVVADTGRGFAETVGAGVGLANIRERLAALYGETARLTLEGNTPRGVVATIDVPAEGTRSGAGMPPPIPEAAPSASSASFATPQVTPPVLARETLAQRFWAGVVVFERGWRKALYYLYLALLVLAALACVGGVVGIAVGVIPVVMDDNPLAGPFGVLIGLAGVIIGFIAVAAVLALIVLLIYGMGFFFIALAMFVIAAVLVGLSPVFAPIVLLGLGIWWLVKRNRASSQAPAVQPVPPAASADPQR